MPTKLFVKELEAALNRGDGYIMASYGQNPRTGYLDLSKTDVKSAWKENGWYYTQYSGAQRMVPESFRTDVLGEKLDANNVLIENANTEAVNFALLFEFDGDIRKIRHVLYNCAASRPSVESKTNEEEIEVQTETLSINATPMASGIVKAKTGDDTTDAVYQNWYNDVYLPVEAPAAAVQSTRSTTK